MGEVKAKGGARKGAGLAPDVAGLKTAKHTVTLDAVTVERMKAIGSGNLSRGIREAARRLTANVDVTGAPRHEPNKE